MGLFGRIFSALGKRKPIEADGDGDEEGGASESGESQAEQSGASPLPKDDVERDPELEAKDDPASFDFARDIARFFTAEFRVEQAWYEPERRDQLLSEYGVRDGTHWYQVKATFERWLESPEGKSKYPNEDSLVQARMTTTQTVSSGEIEQLIEEARKAKAAREGR